jgi:hypothetical protein
VADTTVVKEAGPLPGATALGTAGLSVGFVVMWSSGFIGAELATGHAPALTVLNWRFLILAAPYLTPHGWDTAVTALLKELRPLPM